MMTSDQDDQHPLAAHLHRLHAYAMHLTGGSTADADDLVQDVVERALRLWAAYEASLRDLGGWLRLMTYQEFCRRWRSPGGRMRRAEVPTGELSERSGDLRADVSVLETKQHVAILLAKLPPPQRQAVERVYLHDETDVEAAAELECPRTTVRTRVHRALTGLRG